MIGVAEFAGDWRIERRIDDRRAGQEGWFEGHARLAPDGPAGLRYVETGVLRLGSGPPMPADRTYLWRFLEDQVEVRFEDGRPFHAFLPEGQSDGTDHPCGADLYRVRYDFGQWPAWEARWRVTGPRKAYEMTSLYRRS